MGLSAMGGAIGSLFFESDFIASDFMPSDFMASWAMAAPAARPNDRVAAARAVREKIFMRVSSGYHRSVATPKLRGDASRGCAQTPENMPLATMGPAGLAPG